LSGLALFVLPNLLEDAGLALVDLAFEADPATPILAVYGLPIPPSLPPSYCCIIAPILSFSLLSKFFCI